MNADLQQLKDSELDLTTALQDKLKLPRTKAKVAEKVSAWFPHRLENLENGKTFSSQGNVREF